MQLENALQAYFHKHIPLTQAMDVHVDLATPQKIVLGASFAKNINHKKTVFGGSLHTLATLACWSLVHVNLTDQFSDNVQIVIANSDTKYLIPVTSDFKAQCLMPSDSDWETFFKILQKKKKARIKLSAQIFQDKMVAVDYSGTFVALLQPSESL